MARRRRGPPLEYDLAAGGTFKPGEQIEHGRFSSSIGTNQRRDLPRINVNINIHHRSQTAEVFG